MSILYFRFPKRRGELIRIKISVVIYLNALMRTTKVRVFVETWAACPQEASGSETLFLEVSRITLYFIACNSQVLQTCLLYWGLQQCAGDTGMMVSELFSVLRTELEGLLRLEIQQHVQPNSVLQWKQGTSRRPLFPHCNPLAPQTPSSALQAVS